MSFGIIKQTLKDYNLQNEKQLIQKVDHEGITSLIDRISLKENETWDECKQEIQSFVKRCLDDRQPLNNYRKTK